MGSILYLPGQEDEEVASVEKAERDKILRIAEDTARDIELIAASLEEMLPILSDIRDEIVKRGFRIVR